MSQNEKDKGREGVEEMKRINRHTVIKIKRRRRVVVEISLLSADVLK